MSKTLTISESQSLTHHEQTIESGLQTFFEVGAALRAIRDGRLYRLTHETFEEYCRERWDFSKPYCHRLICSASVRDELVPMGTTLPTSERQCRPLIGLADGDLQEVLDEHFGRPWKEVRKDGRLEDLEQWRDYVSRCIEVDQ